MSEEPGSSGDTKKQRTVRVEFDFSLIFAKLEDLQISLHEGKALPFNCSHDSDNYELTVIKKVEIKNRLFSPNS